MSVRLVRMAPIRLYELQCENDADLSMARAIGHSAWIVTVTKRVDSLNKIAARMSERMTRAVEASA